MAVHSVAFAIKLPLAIAVLADTGTSLLVIANGMRLFRSKVFED
ncbi:MULTISPECIES: hypothetical protein [Nostocaceae]|nr:MULTISPECIES: hypothetical protein [Nostocaceae]